jgi:hypothetical protein
MIRNNVRVNFSTDRVRNTKDAASILAYGPSFAEVNAATLESGALAGELAAYRLRLGKDPETRITSLRVRPRAKPATAIPAVLGLELGDRINVERTPQGVGTAIDLDVIVQGIAHRYSVNGEWDVDVYCSPAPPNYIENPYLVLGTITQSEIGASAGNKVSY